MSAVLVMIDLIWPHLPEQVIFGKGHCGKSVPNDADGYTPMWKKKSIFWDLPYGKDLEVRSAIDVIEAVKNAGKLLPSSENIQCNR